MCPRLLIQRAALMAAVCLAGLSPGCGSKAGNAPNIVLILTDDQGWTSVSYRADPAIPESASDYIETPQMERLARQGMQFTDGYAPNPICSPTRHSLLFGQNAARHIYAKSLDWMAEAPRWLTIPRVLKQANPEYRTAHFGKWHVGLMPDEMGFDYSDGPTANSAGDMQHGQHKDTGGVGKKLKQYNAEHGIQPPRLNDSFSKLPVYYDDTDPKGAVSITRRAEQFMRESVAAGKPFFAYIAHYATHLDMVSTKETYEYFKRKKRGRRHDNPGYAAMAKDMDTAIGRVLDLVKELGIEDNTYIFVTSDNGGVQYFGQTAVLDESGGIAGTHETRVKWRNLPLRHGKHEYYEGGIRVPFLVAGPGIEAGSVCREPVTGLDFLPTFAELAGYSGTLPPNIDGDSIVSVLKDGCRSRIERHRDALIFHQAANRTPVSAIRKGNYKLVKHWMAGQDCKYCGENLLELYDLDQDIGETRDLAKKMPELAEALHQELLAFLKEAGAETKYTRRISPYNMMLKKRNLGSSRQILARPNYESPFQRQ